MFEYALNGLLSLFGKSKYFHHAKQKNDEWTIPKAEFRYVTKRNRLFYRHVSLEVICSKI